MSADEQIRKLYAESDATMAQFKDRLASMRQDRQNALQATGEASSQDGSVRVVVDSTGVVTALTIAPSAFDRSTPDRLAQTIVATIQRAAALSRDKLSAAMAPAAPGEGPLAKAAEALAEYGIPKVGVPEVPRTAVDPTESAAGYGQRPAEPARQENWPIGRSAEPNPPEPSRVARPARPVSRPAREDSDEWTYEERPW